MFTSVVKDKGFEHDRSTYKCMVEKLGEFEAMNRVISEMRRKVVNSLLEGIYNKKATALRLLRNLPERGYDVNAITYCNVICGLYQENLQVKHASCLMRCLKRRCLLEQQASCKSYEERVFKIKEAISLSELLDKDLTRDVIIYNTLISGLCKNSKVDEAESYLLEMVNRGCFPDDFTYNTIIDGYCKSAREGDINRAIELFDEALTKGFPPDAVFSLCKMRNMSLANAVMNNAIAKGFLLNVFTFNILVYDFCIGI
ncbi:pentatricopeptide repeat-containing protein At5g39710-like [Phalaenopsis equestris]|uniref:pentatricopeptide repeat-containing protein At5g39710-like n=1 Tax=Phalaenopsis equestris TaxID=78828 RepID=UPI0009E2129A|nr:pentatricopeptide repeat-containing protein At5g39710-like [Phalaenopsis equestris]